MTREEAIAKLQERGFSVNAYGNDSEGNLITIYATTDPLADYCYGCNVTLATGAFELKYAVPKSISVLSTGDCSPFMDDDHFERIRSKFEAQVKVLHNNFGNTIPYGTFMG